MSLLLLAFLLPPLRGAEAPAKDKRPPNDRPGNLIWGGPLIIYPRYPPSVLIEARAIVLAHQMKELEKQRELQQAQLEQLQREQARKQEEQAAQYLEQLQRYEEYRQKAVVANEQARAKLIEQRRKTALGRTNVFTADQVTLGTNVYENVRLKEAPGGVYYLYHSQGIRPIGKEEIEALLERKGLPEEKPEASENAPGHGPPG